MLCDRSVIVLVIVGGQCGVLGRTSVATRRYTSLLVVTLRYLSLLVATRRGSLLLVVYLSLFFVTSLLVVTRRCSLLLVVTCRYSSLLRYLSLLVVARRYSSLLIVTCIAGGPSVCQGTLPAGAGA